MDMSDAQARADRKSIGLFDTKKNVLSMRKGSGNSETATACLSHVNSVNSSLMLNHYTSASSVFLNRTNSSSRINSTALRFFSNKTLVAKAGTREGRCSTMGDERETTSKENALDCGKGLRVRRKEMDLAEENLAVRKGVGLLKGKSEKRIIATKKFFERKKTVR